jgi:hypothetical protein
MTAICSVDLIARRENERREFIRRAVNSGECFVATEIEIYHGNLPNGAKFWLRLFYGLQ